MTVVTNLEFKDNQDKYLNLALNDHVIIKRDDEMFVVQNFVQNVEPDVIFEPDDDFYRSITMDEVLQKTIKYIRKKHAG